MRFPEPAGSVLEELEAQVRELLGPNLRGMYVYGSLAFECYNPARSDVDVLVVTRRRMAPETRRALSSFLRSLGATPRDQLPLACRPGALAVSDAVRLPLHTVEREARRGGRVLRHRDRERPHARGRARGPAGRGRLSGRSRRGLPRLSRAGSRLGARPPRRGAGLRRLNACRVVAYRRERIVMSKADGGRLGASLCAEAVPPLIAEAAAIYAGEREGELDRTRWPLSRVGNGERVTVVVVGAGQAGLAVSYELMQAGVEHVVLERGRVGQTWRGRWDSFCLVTPNWSVQLPGHEYHGVDPDGYVVRDQLVSFFEGYAAMFDSPVREGVAVTSLRQGRRRVPAGDLGLDRSRRRRSSSAPAPISSRTGRPEPTTLPSSLPQIDVDDYRNPAELPEGRVLVVGSGQSGCQIAEELHQSGRRRRPGVRTGELVTEEDRRPRLLLVVARDRPPRRHARIAPQPGRTPGRQRPGQRSRRRTRSPLSDASRDGGDPRRSLPRRGEPARCGSRRTWTPLSLSRTNAMAS